MSQRAGTKVLLVVAVAEVVVVVVVVVGVAAVVLHVVDVEIRPVDHLSLVAVVGSARADSDDILEFFASALVVLVNVRKRHAGFAPGNAQSLHRQNLHRQSPHRQSSSRQINNSASEQRCVESAKGKRES